MRKAQIVEVICCLACMLLPGRIQAQFFDHSYAIVIGIDHYEFTDTWRPLSYAEKDARAMVTLLSGQGFTVMPFYGSTATKRAVLSAMQDDLAPKLGPRDRVLVF